MERRNMKSKYQEFKLERRIACEGYPPSEARYVNILEYIRTIEEENRQLLSTIQEIASFTNGPITSEDGYDFARWAMETLKLICKGVHND
jgi:hypothetical protein